MKYIDAEKLIAYLKKTMESYKSQMVDPTKYPIDHIDLMAFLAREYQAIIANVESLQQEQPEELHFTPLNRLIQKIPSKNWNETVNNYAKKLRDCLIKEGYLKDAKVLQGYISYMNGNNVPMATMDNQEQPEVDLVPLQEEKMARYINYCLRREDDDCNCPNCGKYVTGLRLFPYYYDRENNDVYFASVCPECGKIIISKE